METLISFDFVLHWFTSKIHEVKSLDSLEFRFSIFSSPGSKELQRSNHKTATRRLFVVAKKGSFAREWLSSSFVMVTPISDYLAPQRSIIANRVMPRPLTLNQPSIFLPLNESFFQIIMPLHALLRLTIMHVSSSIIIDKNDICQTQVCSTSKVLHDSILL